MIRIDRIDDHFNNVRTQRVGREGSPMIYEGQ